MTDSQRKLPLLDLKAEVEMLWEDLQAAMIRVVQSGHFILGPEVQAFEEEVARYLGSEHTIGCNSGTDALEISLRAAGIGAGDEVITTPFTFFATAEAISKLGGTPVFVDIEPDTFNIDVEQIEPAISSRTKAIMPVHLFGQAARMDRVSAIADAYGLKIIEDTAQAFGARFDGRRLGTIGHLGAYSFFPSKNLGAFGDGGLIATDDAELAEQARMLRTHGGLKKYRNERIGYNSRLDAIQAAVLRVKLPYADRWNQNRRNAAARYTAALDQVPWIQTPLSPSSTEQHVYHQYVVRITNGRRDSVKESLDRAGIGNMIYYPVPVHRLPVYDGMIDQSFPEAERAANEVLALPMGPMLKDDSVDRVVSSLVAAGRACAA